MMDDFLMRGGRLVVPVNSSSQLRDWCKQREGFLRLLHAKRSHAGALVEMLLSVEASAAEEVRRRAEAEAKKATEAEA